MALTIKRAEQPVAEQTAQAAVANAGELKRGRGKAKAAAQPGAQAPTQPAAQTAPVQRFSYPLKQALPLGLISFCLIVFSLLNLALTLFAFVTSQQALAPNLIGAVASVLFSVFSAILIGGVLPSFQIRADGLAVRSLLSWRVIPWSRVSKLHSMELQNERYLMFLEYDERGAVLTHRMYALVAGVGDKLGVFLTSDIKGFEDLTRLILAGRMRSTPGARIEELLDENAQMPLFSIIAAPERAMNRLAGVAEDEPGEAMLAVAQLHSVGRSRALIAQASLAVIPVGLFWIDKLTRGAVPPFGDAWSLVWGTLGLLLLGVVELFIVALATQALGESKVGRGEFNLPWSVYPYLESVRVIGFVAALALIAVKAPFVVALLFWLVSAVLVSYLAGLFAQRLYSIPFSQALLTAGASAAMQALTIILFLVLRG